MDIYKILKKLDTPIKVQNFLDGLPVNFEKHGETCYSPLSVLKHKKAHCMEGALFASAAFMINGREPMLMHLRTGRDSRDDDHALALFRGGKGNKYWGAVSKTNHPVLRYRDAIYASPRELAMSYFHEYFDKFGNKTLLYYSRPFRIKKFGTDWITSNENLWHIDDALNNSPHIRITPKGMRAGELRRASKLERRATEMVELKKTRNKGII
ncbi:MAG: hypothetical protein AAB590_03890 [Patescibacteria group bacterium]